MKVEFHPAARTEFLAQAHWYDGQLVGVGDDFLDEIDAAMLHVVNHPEAWPLWPHPKALKAGARRFVLERFPFSVAYVVRRRQVFVVAIAHHRRRPDYWLVRLDQRRKGPRAR